MVIFIRTKTMIITLLAILVILILLSLNLYSKYTHSKSSSTYIDDEAVIDMISKEVDSIFQVRNNSFLEKREDILSTLYNKSLKNGLYAYEHEIKRMKYLHMWADKQSIEFKEIKSDIIVKNATEKGEGFTLNLLVSTEYKYNYTDKPQINNYFRIGTYHLLDIVPNEEGWLITREWYTDPFADSLNLDSIKSEKNKQIILNHKTKDLSDLSERRLKAITYADKYCGAASLPDYGFTYNPKYRNFNPAGGDCTNFASQILYEGGGFSKNRTWNYLKGSASKAWVNASAFNNYMLYSGRASIIARGNYNSVLKSSFELLPGDYIAYEKKSKVVHISVVTGADSKGYILVNSHNSDRYRTPWDLGWSNKNVNFILVRVHY